MRDLSTFIVISDNSCSMCQNNVVQEFDILTCFLEIKCFLKKYVNILLMTLKTKLDFYVMKLTNITWTALDPSQGLLNNFGMVWSRKTLLTKMTRPISISKNTFTNESIQKPTFLFREIAYNSKGERKLSILMEFIQCSRITQNDIGAQLNWL